MKTVCLYINIAKILYYYCRRSYHYLFCLALDCHSLTWMMQKLGSDQKEHPIVTLNGMFANSVECSSTQNIFRYQETKQWLLSVEAFGLWRGFGNAWDVLNEPSLTASTLSLPQIFQIDQVLFDHSSAGYPLFVFAFIEHIIRFNMKRSFQSFAVITGFRRSRIAMRAMFLVPSPSSANSIQ